MWQSLQKLMALPRDTTIYCGHEYTLANARFALTIEPENAALQAAPRGRGAACRRQADAADHLDIELATNPFLRPHVPAIRKRLGMEGSPSGRCSAKSASARTAANSEGRPPGTFASAIELVEPTALHAATRTRERPSTGSWAGRCACG